MLVYLNNSLFNKVARKKESGEPLNNQDIEEAVYEGAALRLRPKLMTVMVDIFGLLPLLLATGTGSDVMKPIAIPFIFGLVTSSFFVLIVLPAMYALVRENELKKNGRVIIAELKD